MSRNERLDVPSRGRQHHPDPAAGATRDSADKIRSVGSFELDDRSIASYRPIEERELEAGAQNAVA